MRHPNKKIKDCWLSPWGEVIYCEVDHHEEGKKIMKKYYPSEPQDKNLREYLVNDKGWARFTEANFLAFGTGWILPPYTTPTQRDKIFDLTGEFLGDPEE